MEIPLPGATGVPVRPVFQWSAVAGAESYELVVSSGLDFSDFEISMVGDNALPGNAWQSDVTLDYDSTYYWKVRAVNSSTNSAWSAIGVFTTELEPASETDTPSGTGTVSRLEEGTTTEPNTSTGLPPDSTLNPASGSQTVVTTVIVELPPSPTPLSNRPTSNTPGWLYYAVGFAGAIIVVLLAIILVLVMKRS